MSRVYHGVLIGQLAQTGQWKHAREERMGTASTSAGPAICRIRRQCGPLGEPSLQTIWRCYAWIKVSIIVKLPI